ncbi:BA75_01435T0 [Komagataella pastoris]|uniref:BA75_01435T0 n=1 Tax=Komagataella pastoris TaxID=4922 RepID=A0A1B2J8M1_PICPA|nr:BA75_01435T0 [Komagataella pastoris]
MSFKSEPLLQGIADTLSKNEALKEKTLQKTKAIFVFNVKNKEGKAKAWALDLKKAGTLTELKSPEELEELKPDATITIKDGDLRNLIRGKSNPQKLFMSGKLKIKGNVAKAASIETVLKSTRPAKSKL